MNITALGAKKVFISKEHKEFYYRNLKKAKWKDVCHKALFYCLGLCDETRKNLNHIYNFDTGSVNSKCLHEEWQTEDSVKVVRIAFSLYCCETFLPGIYNCQTMMEKIGECCQYSVSNLFCCSYAPYFWQAIQIRYPECLFWIRKRVKNVKDKIDGYKKRH